MAAVTIYPIATFPVPPGFNATVLGTSATKLATTHVPSTLFAALYGLPVTGQITWSCTAEAHPTGTVSLKILQSGIAAVRAKFIVGAEITLASIGFSVGSYSEKLLSTLDCPSGLYEVEISLTGKWDALKYKKASFLRGGSGTAPNPVFQDPDCIGNSVVIPPSTTSNTTTVMALAAQVGVSFSPSSNQSGSGDTEPGKWNVEIPKDATAIASAQWLSEAQSRLRHNGCYLDLCSPSFVQAKQLSTGGVWSYDVPSVEISTGTRPEYANVRIAGDFLTSGELYEPEEDTQTNAEITLVPSWVAREPVEVTLTSGSVDPASPPSNTTVLKNLSNNWDLSGDTKTLRIVKTIDGMPSLDQEWIYGFTYTAKDIINPATNKLEGVPAAFWKITQYKQTDYLYDFDTGYALGSNTSGWKLGRIGRESEGPKGERASLTATGAAAELYKFNSMPIIAKSRYILKQFADYYKEAGEEKPPLVLFKVCKPSGGSEWNYLPDPTFVFPMFIAEEMNYTGSFTKAPNPDATPGTSDDNDHISGEESITYIRRVIAPSSNTKAIVGTVYGSAKVGDRYTEFNMEASAQNSQFEDQSMRETFAEREGQPPPATRKPPSQERVPPPTTTPAVSVNPIFFEYRLTTSGYTVTSPDGGSFGDSYSKTANQAYSTAKATLAMDDLASRQYSAIIPFNAQLRPMDRVTLRTGYDTYNTKVTSFSTTVLVQGQLNGLPLVTAPEGTSIECGIDRITSISLTKKSIPAPIKPPTSNLTVVAPVFTVGLTLGDLIAPSLITRRNY